jgi:hypothetical protein
VAAIDWLCFAGTEIANTSRATAYAQQGLKPHTMTVSDCGCPDLARMLGDQDYRRPDLDAGVPWVDPAEPESYEFGGLLVTTITGLDVAPVERGRTDRLGDGTVVGRRRLGPRTIVVRGLLLGSSCCGIEYGLRWLASALDGSLGCGTSTCGGDDLVFLACCPEACEDSPEFENYRQCLTPHLRTLREVALIDGPNVVSEIGGGCNCCSECPAKEVEFTLLAGRPHALRQPVQVAEGRTWQPLPPTDCIEWSTDPGCLSDEAECEALLPTPCPLDPACPPATVPEIPTPSNPCNCDPLAGRSRLCIEIPAGTAPIWADAVPIVVIKAGPNGPLRSVRIRVYANPLGLEYEDLNECGYCSEVNVSYIPASATYTLDGTTRRSIVACPGRAETSGGTVTFGAQGGPLVWPVLECGVPYLVCVEADADTITGATVALQTVVRER